jgi:hypothetical protein
MKDLLLFAALQFTNYLVVTLNYRAIAHEQYVAACLTDGAACVLSYTVVRRIAGDKSKWGVVGMVIGGMAAAAVGIWLTRTWGD